jgi:ABC-type Fe3+ transport system permease subunit
VDLYWAKVNLGHFTGTAEDTKRIGEEERNRRGLTENTSPATMQAFPGNPQPFRIALKYAAIAFILPILGAGLLQFFLQFTLAGRWNTPDFSLYGFGISCMTGSLIGAPLAVIVGLIVGIVTHLKNKYPVKKISD